jgi:tetratricopeptide (TPR) repeat protein
VLLSALGFASAQQPATKPLTKDQLMDLVKGSVSSSRVADLVRQRGIDFEPTDDYLRDLRNAGAESVLIDAVAGAKAVKPPPDPALEAKRNIDSANALMDKGDVDGAIALYQGVVQANPANADAHRLLGLAFGKKKDWQRDVAEQRAALLLNPDDSAAKAELASALSSYEAAQIHTEEVRPPAPPPVKPPVVDDSAERAKNAFSQGQTEAAQRKFEAAAISFSEASQLKPDWPEPLVERAKVYMKLYLFQEAIHSYDQAIRLKPSDPVILNLRGYAYYSASKFPQAVSDFDEAIRLDPGMAEAFQNRGNAKWQMGDKVGANADFAQAKALEPGARAQKKARR